MPYDVRPLLPADVPAAHACSFATFTALETSLGVPGREHTEQVRQRGELRVAHLQRTDPDGAWGAFDADRLVGVALASRRGRLWFLSLLTVSPDVQGAGLGRRLLEAALPTSSDAGARLICSTDDPRALHRYGSAGFALHPCYQAKGTLDRATLPAVEGVREGSWADDRGAVDELALQVRGAPIGPDVDVLEASGGRLLVAEGPAGRGYAVARAGSVGPLAATTPAAARALLVTGLEGLSGEGQSGEVSIDYITAEKQWAVAVTRELRLRLRPSGTQAVDRFTPTGPYLPNGAFG